MSSIMVFRSAQPSKPVGTTTDTIWGVLVDHIVVPDEAVGQWLKDGWYTHIHDIPLEREAEAKVQAEAKSWTAKKASVKDENKT